MQNQIPYNRGMDLSKSQIPFGGSAAEPSRQTTAATLVALPCHPARKTEVVSLKPLRLAGSFESVSYTMRERLDEVFIFLLVTYII